jgi:hypothetical protein
MTNGDFKISAFWGVVAATAIAWAAMTGSVSAQTSGTTPNLSASPQPAAGSDQKRDAGDRGRRGPGGGRERGGRGRDSGKGESAGSPGNTAVAKTTTTPSTPATPEVSAAEKARSWAKEIIQKHDKNGDMMLQESEWEGLGQSRNADANGDKVITLDELIAFASPKPAIPPASTSGSSAAAGGATSGATPPSSESKVVASSSSASDQGNKFVKTSAHNPSDQKTAKDKLKSYRFKTAKERLPAGLPSWFTAKDANGDGQVSMSEYSKSWTESQAAEFKRYDKDNDGIITAEEAGKK